MKRWKQQLERLTHPVVVVSFFNACGYAEWLSNLTKQYWRLPSEAEWEKAARWGARQRHSRLYPWGDTFDAQRCNTHGSGTTPVGAYAAGSALGASPYGTQDMVGNVWEWTRTIFDAQAYSFATPREDDTSECSRVLRGGSWRNDSRNVRTACRASSPPDIGDILVGFRLILDSAPSSA